MDEQHATAVECLEESFKGNVRIRLHEVRTHDGSKTHLVEVAAWEPCAGKTKMLFGRGGIDVAGARKLFNVLTRCLRDYDWEKGEFLFEELE